jgi:hypothetical protein
MGPEQACEFLRAALNVRRVEQAADHSNGVGSRVYYRLRVFFRNSPDGNDGASKSCFCFAVERKGRPRGAGLGE